MIHIATVHWKSSKWIDIQLAYLKCHITEPFKLYAWLNDVPGAHAQKYHYINTENITEHAVKLNILADIIYFDSNREDDLIIFLDGDAFPIGNIISYARQKLKEFPLIAVQRLENNGDLQPHPCFCLTTVGFWKRIGGDWNKGYCWANNQQTMVTDVGGNLLGILQQQNILWYPMHRSNQINMHPLWFGVYDSLIYHHGAAFRMPISRIDLVNTLNWPQNKTSRPLVVLINFLKSLGPIRQDHMWQRGVNFFTYLCFKKHIINKNQKLMEIFFEKINQDPDFYKEY